MNDLNDVLVILQENWQWMFALACLGLYFKDKNKKSEEPKTRLEQIGQKAEAILEEKAEEFIDQVEEEALEALADKVDQLDEKAMEVIKEAIEIAEELAVKEPEPVKSEWHKPNASEYNFDIEGDEDRFKKDTEAFMKKLKDAGYEFTDLGGYPDPSRVAKTRKCPCGSGEIYKKCHASQWLPNPE